MIQGTSLCEFLAIGYAERFSWSVWSDAPVADVPRAPW
jgi:hypothetical protein